MTMVSRTGVAFVVVLLASATVWARPSPAGRAPASAGQAGPAAIGAARGARTAVEQASEGKGAQAPAGRSAQPSPAAPAPARQAQAQKPAPAAEAQKPAPAATEAQTPAPPAAGAQTQVPAGQAPAAEALPPLEPPGFTYNPEGRRDPFVSLVRRGTAAPRGGATGARPAGLGGLETAEVTLKGTVRSREGFVAILQGADQKTYIVRAGDKLFDGTVRTISQNDMVILQQVNDPLSLEKQREVRKVLRQAEAN
jgi:Tfp pilus assembly protein PilP